jgi:hypothetical protein
MQSSSISYTLFPSIINLVPIPALLLISLRPQYRFPPEAFPCAAVSDASCMSKDRTGKCCPKAAANIIYARSMILALASYIE